MLERQGEGRDSAVHREAEGECAEFSNETYSVEETLSAGMDVTGMRRKFLARRDSFLCPNFFRCLFLELT